jgi:UDP-N-acetylmuramoyl-L-alanyl-D-glutamate--2,6-diaminopimelate ligase
MTLRELLAVVGGAGLRYACEVPPGADALMDRTVKALAYDSRRASNGTLFIGLPGQREDGTTYAEQAIGRGAMAVLSERPAPPATTVPWIRIDDGRLGIAVIASAFFDHPSRALQVVGITGTNGKTTTAYLIRGVFEAAGWSTGLLGTVEYRIGAEVREASRTTPEATDLQQMLREMVDAQCRACVMEVSSHALALHRVDGTRFAAGVFTNLTRDHLDYHGDMERYFAAKRRLFELLPAAAPAVLNVDDPRGETLASQVSRRVTYAIERDADVTPRTFAPAVGGLSFDAATPAGIVHIRSQLLGRPNLYNLLAATATCVSLGIPTAAIEAGLAAVTHVPGRFQVVSDPGEDITVIVDYAHTDDALRNLLDTIRPLAKKRLITVFGCGGDRDRSKRPLMGAVAARLSDLIVITSDNPRSEDPARIIEEVERGIATPAGQQSASATRSLGIVDRQEAIDQAVAMAAPGDVVVIAGKGHEKYQVIRDRSLPFDDVEVAKAALRSRKARA